MFYPIRFLEGFYSVSQFLQTEVKTKRYLAIRPRSQSFCKTDKIHFHARARSPSSDECSLWRGENRRPPFAGALRLVTEQKRQPLHVTCPVRGRGLKNKVGLKPNCLQPTQMDF